MEHDLSFIKELPAVKEWAVKHNVNDVELDRLVHIVARGDVTHEGIAKILEMLKDKI